MLSNPLKVVRVPEEKFYMLKLSASPGAPEGIYKMLVTGNMGSFSFERSFNLVVNGYKTTTQATTTTTISTTTISAGNVNEINRFIPLFGIIIFIAILVALYIRKIV
jgi:hypothetical protein